MKNLPEKLMLASVIPVVAGMVLSAIGLMFQLPINGTLGRIVAGIFLLSTALFGTGLLMTIVKELRE